MFVFQSTPSSSRSDLISSIFDGDSSPNGGKSNAGYKRFELPYKPSDHNDSNSPITDIDSLHISGSSISVLETSTQM